MPGAIPRQELIRKFRALGYSGPFSGKRHQFTQKCRQKNRIIERRFGPPSDVVRERINKADFTTLMQWPEQISEAQSLADLRH